MHPAHGSNVILHRNFVWGPVEDAIRRARSTQLAFRATLEPQRDGADRDLRASPRNGIPARRSSTSGRRSRCRNIPTRSRKALRLPGNAVRVHYDVDVGGSYGVKRGIKHTVLVGYLAKRLGMPVRLIEDRLENMRGGDMHGPDRIFDMTVAFDGDGTHPRAEDPRASTTSAPMPAARRSSSASRSARSAAPTASRAIAYEPIVGADQQDAAGSGARLRPGADQFRARTHAWIAWRATSSMDRIALRQKNLIRKDEFPYTHPERLDLRFRRLPRRARQGARGDRLPGARRAARRGAPRGPARRHRHLDLPRAERRQLRVRAAAQSEERDHDVDGFVPRAHRSLRRDHRHHGHVVVGPGPRDAGLDRHRRSAGARPGGDPRGPRRFAAGAAVEQPGRQPHGDHARRRRRRRGAPDQGDADRDRRAQSRMREGRRRIPRRQRQRARACRTSA